MEKSTSSITNHLPWLDLVRFTAIFMVICVHCTDPFNVSQAARLNPDYTFWGTLYGSLLRPCVPLFVIITGFLLLPVRQEPSSFYKKKIYRVLFPFLFWSVCYNLFPWITGLLGYEPQSINIFFAYADKVPSQTLADAFKNILMIPFNFTAYTTHLWYIYMLIGLYLFMPFFSTWLERATQKSKRIYLYLWIITLFIPYASTFISNNLFGECAWNNFGLLYYFAGFNGYLLLGHYLSKGNSLSLSKCIIIGSILFTVGYIITYIGFKTMVSDPKSSEAQIELFFTYCSINVLLMTVAIFLVIQKIEIKSSILKRILRHLTKCGFGIYLVHYFFVGIAYIIVDKLEIPISMRIPTTAIFVFIAAWTFTSVIYTIMPHKARWIMG